MLCCSGTAWDADGSAAHRGAAAEAQPGGGSDTAEGAAKPTGGRRDPARLPLQPAQDRRLCANPAPPGIQELQPFLRCHL